MRRAAARRGRANPLATTTQGVGELMAHAIRSDAGGLCSGSAAVARTMALKMAAALCAVFRDADGSAFVPVGGTLAAIAACDASAGAARLAGIEVVAMCDVDLPMHGPRGAACVFAPQKGASEAVVRLLDDGLRHLDGILRRMSGVSVAEVPGAGAAGAMGAGVIAFLGGRLQRGIDTVLDAVDFDRHLEGADLVITGEGRLDAQSASGKVVSGIVRRAKHSRVPVVVLAGEVDLDAAALEALGVAAAFPINRKCEPFATARLHARESLRATSEQVLRLWNAAEAGAGNLRRRVHRDRACIRAASAAMCPASVVMNAPDPPCRKSRRNARFSQRLFVSAHRPPCEPLRHFRTQVVAPDRIENSSNTEEGETTLTAAGFRRILDVLRSGVFAPSR